MSNAELSERVNLSPSACHRRVQRLEAEGFIKDYVALLDARKMGCPTTVFVEITLSGQADEVLEAFEREVARVPDVLECHLMAGKSDYLLKVVAENTEDFARIHRQYLARLPGVQGMQSSFALAYRVQDDGPAGLGGGGLPPPACAFGLSPVGGSQFRLARDWRTLTAGLAREKPGSCYEREGFHPSALRPHPRIFSER